MAYRNKRIEPTIAEYERQLAEAQDVEPVVVDDEVNQAKTKAKAAKAVADLKAKWKPALQSWQDLYDTWPEDRDPPAMKSAAVAKFREKDDEADGKLAAKVCTKEDATRKQAEKERTA
jgi:hypothetical protein